jgi:tripartite-type tricarboxylate transporter receptor subunit TctC
MPDVPTFAEAGIRDVEVHVWFGFVGPGRPAAGDPRPAVRAITAIARRPRRRSASCAPGATRLDPGPAQMAALIRSELEKWGTVIRAANIRVE